MNDLDLPSTNPFCRNDWTGSIISLDGCETDDFTSEDLDKVMFAGEGDERSAGIVRLKDGRFASWDTYEDVTGDGFSADAYGGDADIFVARDLTVAILRGLSAEGRYLCNLSLSHELNRGPDTYPAVKRPGFVILHTKQLPDGNWAAFGYDQDAGFWEIIRTGEAPALRYYSKTEWAIELTDTNRHRAELDWGKIVNGAKTSQDVVEIIASTKNGY